LVIVVIVLYKDKLFFVSLKPMKRLLAILAVMMPMLSLAAQDLDSQYAVDLLRPGTQAPRFSLNDINGKAVNLSDFQGRKVVLVFWASWCPDCRAEVPELKALHAVANPEKVAFVSVSFDRTLEALQTYMAENYLPGVQLYDPAGKKESKVAADYGVKWIPSLYLLDENGKVELGTVLIEKIAKALGGAITLKKPGQELCQDESCAL
jgi:peroxiredoxin